MFLVMCQEPCRNLHAHCRSWFPGSLRCVAQNPRILLLMNLIQIHYSYACTTFFSLPFYFLSCHFNRVQVQTLPTEQAAPVLTDSFSRGYGPNAHASKARPLTTVGQTSLSVIMIIKVWLSQLLFSGRRDCRPRQSLVCFIVHASHIHFFFNCIQCRTCLLAQIHESTDDRSAQMFFSRVLLHPSRCSWTFQLFQLLNILP